MKVEIDVQLLRDAKECIRKEIGIDGDLSEISILHEETFDVLTRLDNAITEAERRAAEERHNVISFAWESVAIVVENGRKKDEDPRVTIAERTEERLQELHQIYDIITRVVDNEELVDDECCDGCKRGDRCKRVMQAQVLDKDVHGDDDYEAALEFIASALCALRSARTNLYAEPLSRSSVELHIRDANSKLAAAENSLRGEIV